jgi:methionyl-tRNA synthetase
MVTSALPYANGPLHIGHLAGAYLPADTYVRYLRLKGEDVLYVCGSDEHGVPITLRAKDEGISPQDVVDKYHGMIQDSFEKLKVSFDIYHRTSDKLHHQTASEFFSHLHEKGVFTEKESEQYYDEENKQFLADRYIIGTCPKCDNPDAYGDQCEKCGSTLSPNELKNPRSALSGNAPIKKKTSHWYLPLDKMQQDWLEDWIVSHGNDWKPNVYGQCKSWLDGGLQPRAVTRDLDWGVPVPLEDADGKVLYVWFDAPIGYISATKAWSEQSGKDWKPYWQDKETRLVHFIGKDNIVFHCIIFPAMLKAHGDYILPDNVPSMEFLNLEGDKLSTSRNRAVWVHEYLEEFPGKEDVLRYAILSNLPETKDNDFSWKDYQARNNSELLAILGNFMNRVVVLTNKWFDGKVPAPGADDENAGAMLDDIRQQAADIADNLEHYRFRNALSAFMNIARAGNQYLTVAEPWKLDQGDEKIPTIINHALQVCYELTKYMQIFLPHTAEKAMELLNLESIALEGGNLEPGHQIGKPVHLFERIEDDVIEAQIEKLKQASQPASNFKPMITYDDFDKLDLRSGTIKTAEKVEGADKLLKLTIDLGTEERTVVSGIAEHYEAADVLGKQVTLLVNLEPRKIRGIESQGMILMAKDDNGMAFVSPTHEVDDGSVIN